MTPNISDAERQGREGHRVRNLTHGETDHIQPQKTPTLASLHYAVEHNEFSLVYQPQFDCVNGQLVGAEALLRWCDSNGNRYPPNIFVPMLEQFGYITKIGQWVQSEACRQAQAWRSKGFPSLRISVNMSPLQLMGDQDPVPALKQILKDTDLPPECVALELTENVLLQPQQVVFARMQAIVDLGVHLQIDDFGTGFSSIAYLKRLPATGLKIDCSFVQGLTDNPQDQIIVRAITDLARGFALETVAEGVESIEQAALLREFGVTTLQGFLFDPGLAAVEFSHRYIDT